MFSYQVTQTIVLNENAVYMTSSDFAHLILVLTSGEDANFPSFLATSMFTLARRS